MSDANQPTPPAPPASQPVPPAPAAPVSATPSQQLDPNTMVPIMLNVSQVQQVLNIVAKQPLESVIDIFASIKNQAETALRRMQEPQQGLQAANGGNGTHPTLADTTINGRGRPSRRRGRPH